MSGPLTGTRIVDLTAFVAGPLATQLLAEQGADVVKIEPPSGDLLRRIGTRRSGTSALFLSVNRNKRSVVLDLRRPEGLRVLRKLISKADVVVENFRPGAMEKLGLAPDTLCRAHPRLVYARATGFGDAGPYRRAPVFDTLIQGFSGIAWAQAEGSLRPSLLRTLVADKVAPLLTAQAITAALLERERSGRGQTLAISMLDSLVWWMWPDNLMEQTFVGDGATSATIFPKVDNMMQTLDGHITVAPVSDANWQALARVADRPDWLEDPRFSTMETRNLNVADWFGAIREEIAKRPSDEWLQRLRENDVPCAPVNTLDSILEDEQIAASGSIAELDHPSAGRIRQPVPVARFDRTSSRLERPAPDVGQHTVEVLEEAGLSRAEIEALRESGAIG